MIREQQIVLKTKSMQIISHSGKRATPQGMIVHQSRKSNRSGSRKLSSRVGQHSPKSVASQRSGE